MLIEAIDEVMAHGILDISVHMLSVLSLPKCPPIRQEKSHYDSIH